MRGEKLTELNRNIVKMQQAGYLPKGEPYRDPEHPGVSGITLSMMEEYLVRNSDYMRENGVTSRALYNGLIGLVSLSETAETLFVHRSKIGRRYLFFVESRASMSVFDREEDVHDATIRIVDLDWPEMLPIEEVPIEPKVKEALSLHPLHPSVLVLGRQSPAIYQVTGICAGPAGVILADKVICFAQELLE